eukprot:scaffold9719_cov21-Tisochrysis_lutea.AAC.3
MSLGMDQWQKGTFLASMAAGAHFQGCTSRAIFSVSSPQQPHQAMVPAKALLAAKEHESHMSTSKCTAAKIQRSQDGLIPA